MGAVSVVARKSKSRSAAISSPKTKIKSKAKSMTKGKVVQFPLSRVGAKKLRQPSQRERDQLVLDTREQARKLARSILRKWRSRLELEEVDSVVDLSLCEAAKRYNPHRGASFITFLFYHLRGNLIRLVSDAANQNTLPLFDRELIDGTIDSIHASPVANALEVAAALSGQEQVLPDEQLYKKEVAGFSRVACEKLDTLEQEVINRVFMNEENLFDVAENLGYSRCHISRVKRKALDTLQTELKPVLLESNNSRNTRLHARRRPISRRGCHRRELLNTVALSKRKIQVDEGFREAV